MPSSPLHKAPSAIACIPLVVGIIISNQNWNVVNYPQYLLLVPCLALVIFQFIKTKRRSLLNSAYFTAVLLTFLSLGYLRHQHNNKDNSFEGSIHATYKAMVCSMPEEKEKSVRIDLQIDSAFTPTSRYGIDTKIIAYFEKSDTATALMPGDNLRFKSTLQSPSKIMNPEDFDYKHYLQRKHIFATCYIKSKDWVKLDTQSQSLIIIAKRVQNHILNILKDQGFGKEELALVSALTVGYKLMLGEEQKESYVTSGATHVLAVSGLHVGILFAFLSKLLSLFGKSRRMVILNTIIIILILWTFAFITGLSPSVTRATLMFSLVSLGNMCRQRSCIYNTIFLSAFILLIYNPNYLFDLGFQLSYAAVIAIVTFEPMISPFLMKRLNMPKFFAQLIAVSIAAQIGTAPICIHTFNCFPNYFLLTNIWIIPLVSVVVNIALVLIIFGLIGLPTGLISYVLNGLLKLMNFGVNYISELPHALNSPIYIDDISVLLSFIVIIFMTFAIAYHSKRLLFLSTFLIIVGLTHNHWLIEQETHNEALYVFNNRESFNICTQEGLQSSIIYEQDSEMKLPQHFVNHAIAKRTMQAAFLTDNFDNNNFRKYQDFIITKNHIHATYSPCIDERSKKMSVSTLFINKEEPQSIYTFFESFKFETLVLYKKPSKHINYYKTFCEKEGITLHKVYEDGAYITDL